MSGNNEDPLLHCKIDPDELEIGDPIGEGSFGTVFEAQFRGATVAVKTVRVGRVTEDVVLAFRNEILAISTLRHQNLVFMLGACWDGGPDRLALVLEYCGHGSVQTLVDGSSSGSTPAEQQQGRANDSGLLPPLEPCWDSPLGEMALGVCRCVRYLHWDLPVPMLHRDIKPGNVLVTSTLTAKLLDRHLPPTPKQSAVSHQYFDDKK